MVVILFCGKAGVGKTTSSKMMYKYLESKNKAAATGSFAGAVKACAEDYFRWNCVKDEYGRKLLQLVGGFGREVNPDIWVLNLIDTIDFYEDTCHTQYFIVDDCRFPNEIKKMQERYTTYVIRIESPEREILKGTLAYDDLSEISLPSGNNEMYDFLVNNTRTLEELNITIEEIVDKILKMEKQKCKN